MKRILQISNGNMTVIPGAPVKEVRDLQTRVEERIDQGGSDYFILIM